MRSETRQSADDGLHRAPVHDPTSTTITIEPRPQGISGRLRELWSAKALLPYFGARNIQRTYERTWLGRAWIPLRPVVDVTTRVLVFGGLLGAPSAGVPYLLFFLVGMGAWQLFQGTAYWGTRSLELSRGVLKQLYVPRLLVLTASPAAPAVTYAVYLVLTAAVVVYYAAADGTVYARADGGVVVAVLGILMIVALGLALALWTSVYGVRARDVRFTLGYVLSFWFFLTPVVYPLTAVPDGYRTVASLNPAAAPVEMVRLGLIDAGHVPALALASTLAAITLLAVPGLRFFARAEAATLDRL